MFEGNIEFSKGILLVNGFTLLSKIPNKLDEGIMLFVGFKSIVFPLTSIKVVTWTADANVIDDIWVPAIYNS